MQWVFARISSISAMMTERSEMFQTVVNDMHILRHTPLDRQKVYLYAPARFQTETMAIADTYHDNFLRFADNETVNFWQSIETPDSIKVKPVYIGTNGALVTPEAAVEQAGIILILRMQTRISNQYVVEKYKGIFIEDILLNNIKEESEIHNRAALYNWDFHILNFELLFYILTYE